MDIEELFSQMATLAPEQLEELQRFIAQQPYKLEGRTPNAQERARVMAAIQEALLRAPEDENPGLARLREEGYLKD